MDAEQQSMETGHRIQLALRDVLDRLELIIGSLGDVMDLIQLEEVISSMPFVKIYPNSTGRILTSFLSSKRPFGSRFNRSQCIWAGEAGF